jgi:hypothetical protein
MLAKTLMLATALQAGLATALGNAVMNNRCDYDIWLWSVDQDYSSDAIHIPARSQHTEAIRNVCDGCGVSLKISNTDQLLGDQQTQFEYTIGNGGMWYDISFVNCANGEDASSCPGHVEGLSMVGSTSSCQSASCAAGSYCPTQAYYCAQPMLQLGIEEPVFGCPGQGTDMDLYMDVCSGEASLKRSIAGRIAINERA